jgi:hypothetical protein
MRYVMKQATHYIRDAICCLSPIKRRAVPSEASGNERLLQDTLFVLPPFHNLIFAAESN